MSTLYRHGSHLEVGGLKFFMCAIMCKRNYTAPLRLTFFDVMVFGKELREYKILYICYLNFIFIADVCFGAVSACMQHKI